jgi:hypothetical protein
MRHDAAAISVAALHVKVYVMTISRVLPATCMRVDGDPSIPLAAEFLCKSPGRRVASRQKDGTDAVGPA